MPFEYNATKQTTGERLFFDGENVYVALTCVVGLAAISKIEEI